MSLISEAQPGQGNLASDQCDESGPLGRRSSIVGLVLIGAVVITTNFSTLEHLAGRWSREPDYSHGFLVPLISAFLLWHRRELIRNAPQVGRGRWWGVVVLVGSAVLRLWAVYSDFILMEAVALIVCIVGVTVLLGGWRALRWAWPAILFLFFMIPLPGALAGRLSGPLQHLATVCSTYALQTLGMPAIATGNVILLSNGTIGVAEACNGLRMLMMFGAATTAAAILLKVSTWEKLCVLISAPAIAIAANTFRIAATGVAQELAGPDLAERIFHDLAGWIMMPLAMLLLGIEVVLLSKLFPMESARPPVFAARSDRPRKAKAARRAR
jgi:exosortase